MVDIAPGLDRFEARVVPTSTGDWTFRVEGWSDPYGTWVHDATIKVEAGVDVELMLAEGALLLERAAARTGADAMSRAGARVLKDAVIGLRDIRDTPQARLAAGLSPAVHAALAEHPLRDLVTRSPAYPLTVDRPLALAGSWYELFPRSQGAKYDPAAGKWQSGTLRTAALDLPRIAGMGFDVVYLTPVHPIGETHRKGPNNSLFADLGDPGSPYAIGSPAGGHDAIEPTLGTFADFDAFVAAARDLGMEVALDIALQCSPDHPWVKRAPGVVHHAGRRHDRVRGEPAEEVPGHLPAELRQRPRGHLHRDPAGPAGVDRPRGDAVPRRQPAHQAARLLGADPGVGARRPPRGDLPVGGVHAAGDDGDARQDRLPPVVHVLHVAEHEGRDHRVPRGGLGRAGRLDAAQLLADDARHPAAVPAGHRRARVRGPGGAGRPGAPTWGIYSGYELVEDVPRPGVDEQIDNEKYEFKPRDWSKADAIGINLLLGRLNELRHNHPALQQLRNLRVLPTSDDALVAFAKHLDAAHSPTGRADTIVVVVNLDPWNARGGTVTLPLQAFGLDPARPVVAHDVLSDETYEWGQSVYVRLDPMIRAAHVVNLVAP